MSAISNFISVFIFSNLFRRKLECGCLCSLEKMAMEAYVSQEFSISKRGEDNVHPNMVVVFVESLWIPLARLQIDGKPIMPYFVELKKRPNAITFPYLSSASGVTVDKEMLFLSFDKKYPGKQQVSDDLNDYPEF